jgi:type VI secretion system Hcp family effector
LNKLTVAGLSLLAAVAATMPAGAAGTTPGSGDSVFMIVKGQKQGAFAGDTSKKGQIGVYHLEFGGSSPRDLATGMATGKRTWSTVKVIKALDRASPQFFNAFTQNENLLTVEFDVYGPARGADGKFGANGSGEVMLYTIRLTNAVVTSDTVIAPSDKDPAAGVAYGGAVEQLSLVFQKIEVSYVGAGGITSGVADWNTTI